jgi:bud site selection protein 31
MRDAENESHEGKRKTESLWPIMRLNHQRSRYVYELRYIRKVISPELYEWLLKQGFADAKSVIFPSFPIIFLIDVFSLIAKWKKPGYEKLCCVRCIQTGVRDVFFKVFQKASILAYSYCRG